MRNKKAAQARSNWGPDSREAHTQIITRNEIPGRQVSASPGFPRRDGRTAKRASTRPSTVGLFLLAGWWLVYLGFNVIAKADDLDQGIQYRAYSTVTAIPTIIFGTIGLLFLGRALRAQSKARSTWLVPLLVYVLWALCSLLWTDNMELCLRRNVSFLWTLIGAFGIGAGIFGPLQNGLRTFAKAIVVAAVSVSVVYLWLIAPDLTLNNILDPAWLAPYRTMGSVLCGTIVIALIALSGVLVRSRRVLLLWMFLLLTPLLITKARAALIMALVLPVLINILKKKKKRTSRVILGGVAAIVALVFLVWLVNSMGAVMTAALPDRFAVYLERTEHIGQRGSLDIRFDLWTTLWQDIREHFWFGSGFGSYWTDQRIRGISKLMGEYLPFAHNGYIEELLAGGVIGLAVCLWLWAASIAEVLKRAVGERRPYCLFLLGCIAFVLGYNWVDSLFQFYTGVCLVFLFTGLFALSGHTGTFDQGAVLRSVRRRAAWPHRLGAEGRKPGSGMKVNKRWTLGEA